MEEKLYDISEVCQLLGTTSRTLRFYEQKGIVTSTSVPHSARRHYTEEQINEIRNALILRSIGLPVRAIAELKGEGDLRAAVVRRRAEIFAVLEAKTREINLLEEAVASLDEGKSIFFHDPRDTLRENECIREQIVTECSRAFVEDRAEELFAHLSAKMQAYMPKSTYMQIRTDALAPAGAFLAYGRIKHDNRMPNVFYHDLQYQALTLKLKYVFRAEQVHGLWIHYAERSKL
ncbi:MAG: MerR family transcriptional regulator [Clostridia bacterium]|nr:MerR family transcriptional regulator [Clostridia bacterium]